ncbi:Outer membrane efflux protein [Methylibium sp. T29]|nr:Outer membrane efflux protein [Methylibium sp. T29]
MTTPRHACAAAARGLPLVLASLALAGCASFSPDGGFDTVEQVAQERLGKDVVWARTAENQNRIDTRVAELLTRPLTVDDAVQVALLNNKGLQARFFELGIGEAELVQASRLPNPGISFGRLKRGDEIELERGYHLNLARLLAMPLVRQVEERRFAQTRGVVTLQLLSLASEARKAYFNAVAAEETVRYRRQVQQAAEAGAELARRMAEVGNFNKLQRLREQGFYADATLGMARAEHAALASRERLTRLMGLWGPQTRFQLPERLPDLPEAPTDQPRSSAPHWLSAWTSRGPSSRRSRPRRASVSRRRRASSTCWSWAGPTTVRTRNRRRRVGSWGWSCRCSTGAERASRAPRRSTCRR